MSEKEVRSHREFFIVVIVFFAAAATVAAQPTALLVRSEPEKIVIKRNPRPPHENAPAADPAQTVAALREQLRTQTENPVLYNNLGTSYARLAKYPEAAEALRSAIRLDAGVALYHLNLSIVYDHLGDAAAALAAARRALELEPGSVPVHVQFCEMNMVAGRFREAVPCYEKLFRMTDKNVRLLTTYAFALLSVKKTDRAAQTMEDCVALFPDSAPARNGYGLVLSARKDYKKAIAEFRRAIELDAAYAPAQFNLGIVLVATRDKAAAIRQYQLMRSLNPNYAEQLYRLIYADKLVFVGDRR